MWRAAARLLLPAVLAASLAAAGGQAGAAPGGGWTTYGDGPARTGEAATPAAGAAPAPARAFVLPLEGRITGQVLSDGTSFYAATTAGEVVAFTAGGEVRWRDELGQLTSSCAQLDGYGVVGTGVIDPSSGTLYVADAFGRLHALDLATGAERSGWPVRVFSDDRRELVWGALTLADGAVYVPTASYCDSPSLGGVYRVDLATQQVSSWVSVPADEGGGGGVWGWGGTAYDAAADDLYADTANAFGGGSNMGAAFSESAGYGEHVVELDPELTVAGADHPDDLTQPDDLDFVGSPVLADRPGCGELVVAADKDDDVYAWHAGDLDAGPAWELQLEPFDPADPLLSQLAWSSGLDSLYAVTGTELVRIAVGPTCQPRVAWREPLGTRTENGSPTIAGGTVWFAVNGTPALDGYDAATGARLFAAPLGGTTVEAPAVADGRLVVGTMSGNVDGFALGPAASASAAAAAPVPVETSWAGARDGLQRRASGVYATQDGGRSWRLVFPHPALAVVRVSRELGLLSTGAEPGACMCATRQLVTLDGGTRWHEIDSLPEQFLASGGRVYFWEGGRLGMLAPLRRDTAAVHLASTTLASIGNGRIVDVEPVPGGVAALVTSRVDGEGWDTTPRVVLVRDGKMQTVTLPAQGGSPLVQRLAVAWPRLTVTAVDFVADPPQTVTWTSGDGGVTWAGA